MLSAYDDEDEDANKLVAAPMSAAAAERRRAQGTPPTIPYDKPLPENEQCKGVHLGETAKLIDLCMSKVRSINSATHNKKPAVIASGNAVLQCVEGAHSQTQPHPPTQGPRPPTQSEQPETEPEAEKSTQSLVQEESEQGTQSLVQVQSEVESELEPELHSTSQVSLAASCCPLEEMLGLHVFVQNQKLWVRGLHAMGVPHMCTAEQAYEFEQQVINYSAAEEQELRGMYGSSGEFVAKLWGSERCSRTVPALVRCIEVLGDSSILRSALGIALWSHPSAKQGGNATNGKGELRWRSVRCGLVRIAGTKCVQQTLSNKRSATAEDYSVKEFESVDIMSSVRVGGMLILHEAPILFHSTVALIMLLIILSVFAVKNSRKLLSVPSLLPASSSVAAASITAPPVAALQTVTAVTEAAADVGAVAESIVEGVADSVSETLSKLAASNAV